MMARSTTRSNQRPDTLMQDRICQVDETSCNARPDHTLGSIASLWDVCFSVRYPQYRTLSRPIGTGLPGAFLRPNRIPPAQPRQLRRSVLDRPGEMSCTCAVNKDPAYQLCQIHAEPARVLLVLVFVRWRFSEG